ncbi:MAG: PEGA domain-containing protein [Acidobacteria bacterium]|nr:PEGA domain-containing protein [Acidobacteriota bacterium]
MPGTAGPSMLTVAVRRVSDAIRSSLAGRQRKPILAVGAGVLLALVVGSLWQVGRTLTPVPPPAVPLTVAPSPAMPASPPATAAAPGEQTKGRGSLGAPVKNTSASPTPVPEENPDPPAKETLAAPSVSPIRRLLRAIPLRSRSEPAIPEVVGRVAVHTDPAGAKILIDGEETSYRTPVNLPLAPGRHRITVERSGFASETRQVVVHKDEMVQMRLELKPN